jgi:RNA polymerase sigma-70 factor, ECF subfamily
MNGIDLLPVIVDMTTSNTDDLHHDGSNSDRLADESATDAALRALYAEHGRALLSFAVQFTGDRGRAEDIVQETFLRAWRHLPALLADGRPVRPWLYQVTRRLLMDAARAAKVRPPLVDSTSLPEPAVEGGFEQVVDHQTLLAALEHLSPVHQEIVVETFFLGTPLNVSAKRLGLPPGTARSRLHHALLRLREYLQPVQLAA